jgi:hypothetical protein
MRQRQQHLQLCCCSCGDGCRGVGCHVHDDRAAAGQVACWQVKAGALLELEAGINIGCRQ